MRNEVLVVLLAVVAVASVATFALYQGFHQVNMAPQSMVIRSNISLGLELTATITPTVLTEGQNISIVAEINNTLSKIVKVNATSLANPAYGPCQQGFATSIRIYSGNYSYTELFNNRSQPMPLLLYNPSLIYTCPEVFNFRYTFNPKSAIATIQPGNETKVVRESSVVGGYWTSSGQTYTFHDFQPGKYTVVVYDAWGQQLIGYFQV